MQSWTATKKYGVKEKEAQKDLGIQEICFLERTYSEKVSVNSWFKAI